MRFVFCKTKYAIFATTQHQHLFIMRYLYSTLLRVSLCILCLASPCLLMAEAITASTTASPKWFRIYAPNRSSLTLMSNGAGANMTGSTTADYSDSQLWLFESRSDGTYNIICKSNSVYIDPNTTTSVSGNPVFRPTTTVPTAGWTVTAISGQTDLYIIKSGSIQLHQGESGSGYRVLNYGGGNNTTDTGCQFRFESYDPNDPLSAPRITANTFLNTQTSEGTNPGQYTAAVRTTFKNAIAAATTTAELTAATNTYKAAMNPVKVSTDTDSTYYYIVSGPSATYCEGKVIYSPAAGESLKWGDKQVDPNYLWKMEDAGNGKFYIRNMATKLYFAKPITNGTSETKNAYSINSLGSYASFNIVADGYNPIHAQQNGNAVVNWAGGLNSASAWRLEVVDNNQIANLPVAINSVTVKQGFLTTAPGHKDHTLLLAQLNVSGFKGSVSASGLTLNLTGSTSVAADIDSVKVYYTPDAYFNGDKKKNAVLWGKAAAGTGTITINFAEAHQLKTGTTNLWITADVKSGAIVDDVIDATLLTVIPSTGSAITVSSGNPTGTARVFNKQTNLYNPYDENSHYWRIPAMIVLRNSQNGHNGRILTITDKRYDSNGDLPNYIDLIARHSDDNGASWSDTTIVAGVPGREPNYGYGDGAVVETQSGKIVVLMAAQNQFQGSSYSSPIRMYMGSSSDGGNTWNRLTDITTTIYNATYTQGQLQGVFASSGKGLCLTNQTNTALNGRIMFAMVCKFSSGSYQNYIVYSDDEGATWKVSSASAYNGADEAKLVELNDGTIMISVRTGGNRGLNKSTDGGITWGTQYTAPFTGGSCNADILRYSNKILLHSVPDTYYRQNVTVYASTDNGATWPYKKSISQLSSGYSSLERLADGSVAIYFEDGTVGDGYTMNFCTFPITWLVAGSAEETALRTTIAAARVLAASATYTDATTANVGEYNAAVMAAFTKLIPTDTQIANLTEYTKLDSILKAGMARVRATGIVVKGFEPGTLFTISSKEIINSTTVRNLSGTGTNVTSVAPVATDSTQMWLIMPAETAGAVTIKNMSTKSYLVSSSNKAALQSATANWALEKATDGDYYYLHDLGRTTLSYLVIKIADGSLDYYNKTTSDATWSTKFTLTKAGVVDTGLDAANGTTTVSVVNNRIVVNGTNNFSVYNTAGLRVNPKAPLAAGVYVVNANGKATSVIIR